MTLPGYIDRQAGRERAKQQILQRFGADFEPPEGWDSYWGPDDPVKDMKCQMCGQMVTEVRPFGPNHESICEECAAKDMETTLERYRALNPDG